MENFKTVFKFTMLVVGTIVGAGLASGQEIVVFFAQYGFVSLFFNVAIFFIFFFGIRNFLRFEKCTYENDFKKKKISNIFDIISIVIFAIIGSTMLAGASQLLSTYVYNFSFPVWEIVLILLSSFVCFLGIKALTNLSIYLVPVVIFGIIYVCIKGATISTLSPPTFSTDVSTVSILIFSSISYCCCNLVTASKVIFDLGKSLSQKQASYVAFFSSLVLSIIIFVIIISILINDEMILFADLPLVFLANMISKPVGIGFTVIILACIITTLFATQYSFINLLQEKFEKRKRFLYYIISILTFFFISLIGFGEIIKYLYPIIGAFGFVMIFFFKNLTFKSCFNSTNYKIHSSRK